MGLFKFQYIFSIFLTYFLINCNLEKVENDGSKHGMFAEIYRNITELPTNDKRSQKTSGQERQMIIMIVKNKPGVIESQTNTTSNIERSRCPRVTTHNCYMAVHSVYYEVCKMRYNCGRKIRKKFKRNAKRGCRHKFERHIQLGFNQLKNNSNTCALSALRIIQEGRLAEAVRERYFNVCSPLTLPLDKEILRKRRGKCEYEFRRGCEDAIAFGVGESCRNYKSYCSSELIQDFYETANEKCIHFYRRA